MRICVLIDAWYPVWGGGQTHVWEIACRMVKNQKFEIDIYTRSLLDIKGKKFRLDELYYGSKLRVFRVGNPSPIFDYWGRFSWSLQVVRKVLSIHQIRPYDVVHGHAYFGAIPTKTLGMILKLPTVFTVHGSLNMDQQLSVTSFFERVLLTMIPFDVEISVSKSFLKYFNINKNIEIIPNGIDGRVKFSLYKKKKSGILNLLSVGRLEKQKGFDLLLNAFAELLKTRQDVLLRIAGEGSQMPMLQNLTYKLGIQNKVSYIGLVSNKRLINEYRNADIFVLSSRAEGHSIAMLEACMVGLPVIATDVGDNRLLVRTGWNGILVQSENIVNLTKALIKICDSQDRLIMGRNGQKFVLDQYDWAKIAAKTALVYERVSQKKHKHG